VQFMKFQAGFAGVALALQLVCSPSIAQDTDPVDVMEEIVVLGELTPSRLRFQIERAQDDIYRLFNQLLDDKEYKVNCKKEAATGSYIIRRSCEPAFLTNERARNSAQTMAAWRSSLDPQDLQLSMEQALSSSRVSESELRFDVEGKYEAMNQEMFDLAISNPELMAAMQRYADLKSSYDALTAPQQPASKKKRCGLFSRNCAD
jgi:hypothetical protein